VVRKGPTTQLIPWLLGCTTGRLLLRFVTNNPFKVKEAQAILAPSGFEVRASPIKLEELQTEDAERLVKDKCLKAFDHIRHPLFVEHTGLYLKYLNDLPGGLTQIFWDRLRAERFAEIFGRTEDPTVIARTIVGYVDGRKLFTFSGEVPGRICCPPRGPQDFQWDCVFVPDGFDQTFAELGDRKNEISMRRRALDSFAKELRRK
jgi:XTP/dITP diphosphohydrolase